MRKVTILVLLSALVLMAGCATPQPTAQPTAAPPVTAPTTAPPAVQEKVIELWTHEFPPLQTAMSDKWIPEFEASHPGVKVQLTAVPMVGVVAYDAKLLATLSAGGGPDVWDMTNYEYPRFLDNDLLAPLDPTIFGYASNQELIESYMPHTLDFVIRDDKVYGMFSEYNTLCLYYNLDVFEDAGVEPLPQDKPVSWAKIQEIAAQVRTTDPASGQPSRIGYQFGFFASFRSPYWYSQMFYPLLRQYGQEDFYIDGKPAANTKAVQDALQVFYDFTHVSQAYDPLFLSNWFADFAQGRVSMVLAGTWLVPAIKEQNPDVRFGVAPHPVLDPEDKATYQNVQWSYGWSVNANKSPEQQALAQEFIAFIVGKKGESAQSIWWFDNMGYTHPSHAFYTSEGYTDKLASAPYLKPWVDAATDYTIKYAPHSTDEPGSAMVRAIDRVVYDKMSPADSAQLFQAELERIQ